MKHKLLALDMDGTLLTNDKRISAVNLDALKKAREYGIEIVIATGRSYSTLKPYLDVLSFDCFLITNNGSIVRNKDHSVKSSYELKPETSVKIVEIFKRYKVYFHGADQDNVYIDSLISRFIETKRFLSQENQSPLRLYPRVVHRTFFNQQLKRLSLDEIRMGKVRMNSFFALSNNQRTLEEINDELSDIDEISITSSSNNNIEALHRHASKGRALLQVGETLGISPDEMVAVGDHLNDISMFDVADVGVAVGNADPIVINVSDYQTRTNEEDGIAYVVEQMIKGTWTQRA